MINGLLAKILYQKRWFIIGWVLGFMAMALFMILLYPELKASKLDELLSGLSPALQKVAGGTDTFSNINNYIGGEVFALRMPLLSIIMSIVLFVGLFVGDEKKGTLLTQLSLPLSRSKIMLTKLLAALVILIITTVGMYAGIVIALALTHESADMMMVTKHVVGCVLIGLDFGLVAFLLGGGFGLRGVATGTATLLAFLSYLLSSMVAVADVLKPYEKLSLFHYYQNPSPISLEHIGLMVTFGLVCAVIGLIGFQRRDIN